MAQVESAHLLELATKVEEAKAKEIAESSARDEKLKKIVVEKNTQLEECSAQITKLKTGEIAYQKKLSDAAAAAEALEKRVAETKALAEGSEKQAAAALAEAGFLRMAAEASQAAHEAATNLLAERTAELERVEAAAKVKAESA